MSLEDTLIIGAGPFGLSISAHLRALGRPHRLVGRALDTWRSHMPPGMKLRSEPYGSDMYAPADDADVRAYCQQHGLDYVDRLGPLSIERWLDYGSWFEKRFVPQVDDVTVTDVRRDDSGFTVSFADAEPMRAGRVVVATGVLPYAVLPDEVAGLPRDLVSHTGDHHDLSGFAGRAVAVVGSGQSALETAALLHEAGARTTVVARTDALNWLEPNPAALGPLGALRRPPKKLCEGWRCAFWNTPSAFRLLPRDMRVDKARSVLGPAGAWWLKDRVDGVVEVLTSTRLSGAEAHGNGVRLLLDRTRRASLDVDHVVCGTGFRIDVAQLPFLSEPLLSGLRTLNRYPVLDRAGGSSVPGLFFVGAPASVSLGPSTRFIAGTHTTVAPLVRAVTGRRPTKLPVTS